MVAFTLTVCAVSFGDACLSLDIHWSFVGWLVASILLLCIGAGHVLPRSFLNAAHVPAAAAVVCVGTQTGDMGFCAYNSIFFTDYGQRFHTVASCLGLRNRPAHHPLRRRTRCQLCG